MAVKNNPDHHLVLFTAYSKRLMVGRAGDIKNRIYPIYGFVYFLKKSKTIWSDAAFLNPYALWYLTRISALCNSFDETLSDMESNIINDLSNDTLKIQGVSSHPISKEEFIVKLDNPYSWNLARMIKRFDEYVLSLFKLNLMGLIKDREMVRVIEGLNKKMLGIFSESVSYFHFEIIVQDTIDNSSVYVKASNKMGVIPPSILSGENKGDFVPVPKRKKL